MEVLKRCQFLSGGGREFIEVQVLGTEIRSSLFKNYTVYIAQIRFNNKDKQKEKENKDSNHGNGSKDSPHMNK